MPDLREVFDVVTNEVRPESQALDRQFRRQRRRIRRRALGGYAVAIAAFAAAVVLGIAALRSDDPTPGGHPTTPPAEDLPTVERLQGIWSSGTSVLVRFQPDGTFAADDRGNLVTSPAARGTYEVSGDTITFFSEDGSECVGDDFAWRTTMGEGGRLHAVWTIGGCGQGIGSVYNLTRVSPASPAGSAIDRPAPGEEAERPELLFDMAGVWLRQGTGELLSIREDGTYTVDDGGLLGVDPDDAGIVDFRRSRVTFTSSSESRECSERDRVVWSDVRIEGSVLSTNVLEDACGGNLGTQVWVLLSAR